MAWPYYQESVTVVDVLDVACTDGVLEWVESTGLISGLASDWPTEEFIQLASHAIGGDSYGSGYGYGDGDGSGYGDGYGYGDGSGDGSGYGSGDGYGDGSGYGSGHGSGYGYGYGE